MAGTLGQGGAERQLYYILKVLKEAGAEPRVLCLTRGEYWEKRIEELGVPVVWVGQSKSRILRLIKIITELAKNKPEVIQSQHFYCNLYAVLAARILSVKEIGAIRSDAVHNISAGGKYYGPLSLRLPRKIAVNSKAAIENAVSAGAKRGRLFYLPNAVDCKVFSPGEAACERDYLYILSAGRMSREKRFDRMLNVLRGVIKNSTVPIRISIAGDGPLRQELERQAAFLGLSKDIDFCGIKTDDEMPSFYRQGDIFLLTSDYEGTPNVILEAMASGLCVVAASVGDLPNIISHGEPGFLFNHHDENAAAEVLLELTRSRNLREKVGQNARAAIQDRYSFEKLASSLSALYGNLIRNKREL